MQLLQPWLNCQWVRGATNIYCHQLCFIYMFYITLIPCQASCQVCLLTYGGRVNSPSFDDIWQTSPAIHPPRHLVLHLSHVCEINTNAFFLFFKDNFSYETAAGQQHLRCRKKILAQNYDPMISHNTQQWTAQCTDFTRHSSIHPNLHFSNNIVGRFNIEVPSLTASNKGVNYARGAGHLISASCHAGWWVWNWSQQWWSNFRSKLNVNLITMQKWRERWTLKCRVFCSHTNAHFLKPTFTPNSKQY